MCRTRRATAEWAQRVPTIDYSQVAGDICDEEDRASRQPVITNFTLRSDGRLQHLLGLRKGVREQLLEVSAGERQQLYLLRKAEEKTHKLARKNRRLSIQHLKGERRKTCRPGMGKSGSSIFGNDDMEAAIEHAYASVHESHRCQPIDICASLEQLMVSCNSTLWDEAVARAALAPVAPRHLKQPLSGELQLLVDPLEKTGNAFDALRAKFLRRHGKALIDSLDQCTEGRSLTPAPLAPEVSDRFLAACGKGARVAQISPGFHGTAGDVHQSIFSCGLLIPGQNNNIKVANGSAHGNGVYIAKLSNPWLSQGFARGVNKMFVCGVVDDAVNLKQAERIGALPMPMTKQSTNVRHVRDAMVVFESVRVAPLFVAEWQAVCRKPARVAPKKRNKRGDAVRERRSLVCHSGTIVRNHWAWEAHKHRRGSWFDENFKHHFQGSHNSWRYSYNNWRRFAW